MPEEDNEECGENDDENGLNYSSNKKLVLSENSLAGSNEKENIKANNSKNKN